MTYRFLRRLSGGGFSEVFSVEDPASALPERLVLKRLNAEMSARPEVREAFASEAKILRELRHANIVTFRRCYYDEAGQVCLLMEEVAGEPLDVWASRHADEPDAVLDVFGEVLAAVDYLHHRPDPYLHLDLKPDNILVTSAGGRTRPVLIDFGIARRFGGPGLRAYTPPYAAPEQESGRKLGPRADVHALGRVLAELLERLELSDDVAGALAQVAQRAHSRSRSARFADAGQMGLGFRLARRAEPPPTSRWRVGALPRWAWFAAAATILLIGVVGVTTPHGERDDPTAAVRPANPVASSSDPDVASGATADRIEQLLAEARRAALDEQFDHADRSYLQAKRLADSLVQDEAATEETALALETVRRQIDLARTGGWSESRSQLDLQEKPDP